MSGSSRPRLIGKPPGSQVVLRVTWHGDGEPLEDDVFRSSGGSLYFVDEVSRFRTGRYRLTCTKLDPESFEGDVDWHLVWDRRK